MFLYFLKWINNLSTFIDQGLITLIHSFGLIPTIFFLYFFYNSKIYFNLNLDCKFFVNIILLENLFITEFFLLSRYILPLIIYSLFKV